MNTTKKSPVKGLRLLRTSSLMQMFSSFFTIAGTVALLMGADAGVSLAGTGEDVLTPGLVGATAVAGIGGLVALGGILFILLSSVLEFVALIKLSGAHVAYKVALVTLIGGGLISLLISFLPADQIIGKVLNLIPSFINLAIVYFVIKATSALLLEIGNGALIKDGVLVRNAYVMCTGIIMVSDIVLFAPTLASIENVFVSIAALVQLVALFKYIGFLKRAAAALAK